jgi:DNA polymerase (family 10)
MAYATGSKEHNVALRSLAKDRGILINERGFWSVKTNKRLGGTNEKTIYRLLDLPYYPPELREGTILHDTLPDLLTAKDLTCDLHHHTNWSGDADESYSINDAVWNAKNEGLDTIAITDHSYSSKFDDSTLNKFLNECKKASTASGIKVLAGVEVDITLDGTLQWKKKRLKQLDIVLAAIHKQHNRDVQARLIAAIKHPRVDVIAHPTGRLFGKRDIPHVDWSEVFRVAAKYDVAMEINGGDERLDLPSELITLAIERGCKFTLSSDSHSGGHIKYSLSNALGQARRAGLTSKHLLKF